MIFLLVIRERTLSETSVYNKPTRRHVPADGILHSHRRDNLKSYKVSAVRNPHLK
jgi:hypothetical protein